MKTVKQITQQYEGNDFGIEIIRDKTFPKRIEIKSWWGKHNIYENICKDLLKEGYTLFR